MVNRIENNIINSTNYVEKAVEDTAQAVVSHKKARKVSNKKTNTDSKVQNDLKMFKSLLWFDSVFVLVCFCFVFQKKIVIALCIAILVLILVIALGFSLSWEKSITITGLYT